MNFNPFFLIAFVILSIVLLGALPSSSGREGMETSTPVQKVTVDPTAELTKSVRILNDRLTLLEKSVKESKDKIAGGEAEANAAVGNLQMTLPS